MSWPAPLLLALTLLGPSDLWAGACLVDTFGKFQADGYVKAPTVFCTPKEWIDNGNSCPKSDGVGKLGVNTAGDLTFLATTKSGGTSQEDLAELLSVAAAGGCTDGDVAKIKFQSPTFVVMADPLTISPPPDRKLVFANESNGSVQLARPWLFDADFFGAEYEDPVSIHTMMADHFEGDCAITLKGNIEFRSIQKKEAGAFQFRVFPISALCLNGDHHYLEYAKVADIGYDYQGKDEDSLSRYCPASKTSPAIRISGSHNLIADSDIHSACGHGVAVMEGAQNEIRRTLIYDLNSADLFNSTDQAISHPDGMASPKLVYFKVDPVKAETPDAANPTVYAISGALSGMEAVEGDSESGGLGGRIDLYRFTNATLINKEMNAFVASISLPAGHLTFSQEITVAAGLKPNERNLTAVMCYGTGQQCDDESGDSLAPQGFGYLSFDDNEDKTIEPCEGLATVFKGNCLAFYNEDDPDGDGVNYGSDNCPETANPQQEDDDGDGMGNLCDPDQDGDGAPNATDTCLTAANPTQADGDGDGLGDACDDDKDGDGLANDADNCPAAANADQADAGKNGVGDACETDADGDGVLDDVDACLGEANSGADGDGDGIDDICDTFACNPAEFEEINGECIPKGLDCSTNETPTPDGCVPIATMCEGSLKWNGEECVKDMGKKKGEKDPFDFDATVDDDEGGDDGDGDGGGEGCSDSGSLLWSGGNPCAKPGKKLSCSLDRSLSAAVPGDFIMLTFLVFLITSFRHVLIHRHHRRWLGRE